MREPPRAQQAEGGFLSPARLVIFVGAFGSGKTEIAINYALASAAARRETAIVDLDVVNPYFRVGEHRERLSAAGLRVIAPEAGLSGFDTPALSPEIAGVFQRKSSWAVLDVGGDQAGTRALGQYAPVIRRLRHELWLVINGCRPETDKPEAMVRMAHAISQPARLEITGLVNNTNLLEETRPETVLSGHRLVAAAARELGLPVVFAAASEPLSPQLRGLGCPLLTLRRHLLPPWQG